VAKGSLIPGTQNDRVKLNFKGMGELLRSPMIADELSNRMRRVQAAVPGSQLQVLRNGRRARAKVLYGSDFDEAATGALGRALDLAGGQRGVKTRTNKPRARKAKS
jgi:hypothetical protein